MNKEKNVEKKGENDMNAYAVKPDINIPFVTTKALKRTPATKENKDMVEYMDSHEFSFRIDKDTGKFVSGVVRKNGI